MSSVHSRLSPRLRTPERQRRRRRQWTRRRQRRWRWCLRGKRVRRREMLSITAGGRPSNFFFFATAGRHASSLPRRGLLRVGVHAAGLLALWFTRRLLAATFAGCAAATIGHRTFATAARIARIRTFCGGSGARLGPSTHQGWSAPPNNRRWPVTFGLHLAIHHAHSAAGSYRGAALYIDTRGARCGYQLWHGAVRL